MSRLVAMLLLPLFGASAGAIAATTLQETANVRGLLLSAIESRDGTADAWLIGAMAQQLKNETRAPANSRVRVSVSTLQVIRPGCKRLRLLLAIPSHKMKTVKGTMEPFQMYYELNLCRDGQPPKVSPVGMGVAQ
jgi:hypothetical protein